MKRITALLVSTLVFCVAVPARGQAVPVFPVNNGVAGVYIDADGTVRNRQVDNSSDLATQRLRAKALSQPPKSQAMTYVSLPKALAELRTLTEQKKEVPDNVRFMSGITQIRYVFVYAGEHDIVIAGTSEPIDATNKAEPTGKVTGRPVLHLDDLVTALRCGAGAAQQPFGCSIDPRQDSMTRANQVMKDLANSTRAARMNGMKDAIGLQDVRQFGAPADSRTAFVTVAADYKLKRMILGLEAIPVPGVGSPVDNTRAAGNRFWFEVNYAPLLVSPDADAFELRGPRLVLKAGAFSFDPKGATETSKTFAKNFSAKITQLATTVPLYADLQNVVDLSVVAALIRKEQLAQKAGVDLSWVLAAENYKPATFPTPRTAETLVNFTGGSIVAGGVTIDVAAVVADGNREADHKEALKPVKGRPSSDNWSKTTGEDEPKAAAK
jgi:hypothetical protein